MATSYDSVGLQVVTDDLLDLYIDGAFVSRHITQPNYPRIYGNEVTLGVAAAGGMYLLPHVDRIEFWDERGGTLLWADDFNNLAAWTPHDTPMTVAPPGFVYGGTGGYMGLNGGQPPDTTYVEVQGIYFDDCVPTGYFAVVIDRNDGTDYTNGWDSGGGSSLPMHRYNEGHGVYLTCETGPFVSFTDRAGGFLTGAVAIGGV